MCTALDRASPKDFWSGPLHVLYQQLNIVVSAAAVGRHLHHPAAAGSGTANVACKLRRDG